jgi:hypothetical protein
LSPSEYVDSVGPHSTADDVEPLLDHPESDESHVLQLLRKRELPGPVIEAVARHERWSGRQVLRAAIVMHQKTPRTLSLRLLNLLLWRDQLRVATHLRLPVPLRVAAEARLKERYPELELGEKISLSRTAPTGLVPQLAAENDPRVIAALLQNPRLVELDVVGIVRRGETRSEVLRVVSKSERWIVRPAIRVGVLSHPNTPVHVSLSLLSRMPPRELRKLVRSRELPKIVAVTAERILSEER